METRSDGRKTEPREDEGDGGRHGEEEDATGESQLAGLARSAGSLRESVPSASLPSVWSSLKSPGEEVSSDAE